MGSNYLPIPLQEFLRVNQDELSANMSAHHGSTAIPQTAQTSVSLVLVVTVDSSDNNETNSLGHSENNISGLGYPQQASPSLSLEVTNDDSETNSTFHSDNNSSEWVYVSYARNRRKHPPPTYRFEIKEVEPLFNIKQNTT